MGRREEGRERRWVGEEGGVLSNTNAKYRRAHSSECCRVWLVVWVRVRYLN